MSKFCESDHVWTVFSPSMQDGKEGNNKAQRTQPWNLQKVWLEQKNGWFIPNPHRHRQQSNEKISSFLVCRAVFLLLIFTFTLESSRILGFLTRKDLMSSTFFNIRSSKFRVVKFPPSLIYLEVERIRYVSG